MAIANANYEFIMIDFGVNGRISDGGVLEYTNFFNKLVNKELNIPPATKVLNSCEELPYVFIGDEAFSLRADMLKPFPQRELNKETKIYNYRLSRARRIIENVFGILAARFRIFHTAIPLQLHNTDTVVACCCVLHNYLRRKCSNDYIRTEDLDNIDARCFMNLQTSMNRNPAADPKRVREMFVSYFNNEGAVEWQNKIIQC